MSRGERNMTKNRIVKYATNTALLAVLAAAGIGAYQLGTSKPEENIQEEQEFVEMEQSTEEEPMVDVGTTEVEADMENTSGDLAGTEMEDGANGNEEEPLQEETAVEENGQQPEDGTFAQSEENTVTDAAAGAVEAPVLNFSEETQMEWPVNGNILLDYNMDQTVYFPTLDQYKLSPAIAVQAAEGAPVLASVPGTVYSIEENAQTGTTVTMEIGSGYQAVYGQLKDLAVEEGATVDKGTVIGYIAAPTKYYSEEGSNLYFAMKKDGEPVDPIAYLPE
ncbi:MAG: peptidoglycan DD-metalloendopeptidase family protein [Blautia sp.]|nr:peptidoglycan DD-metalloendopeptidase family protein [Blautia sp.]NSG67850.1 peptidoglycan DD-metalloendopeptidase family protein [Blautia caecimuris]